MHNSHKKVVCQFEIDEQAAEALALFLKRLIFEDWQKKTDPSRNAEDRIEHAYWMRSGCEAVQRGLAKQGFSTR